MCFLIKTLNNQKKKKKLIVELHKHPMGFKIHDLTLQLGGRKCHLCQSSFLPKLHKIENGTRIVKYTKDLNQV